jgi:medium-chain acyl-[acyl-carrier-protein] hydrolase
MNAGSAFLIARPDAGARMRLFCFPHAGGGPNFFFRWTLPLEPEIECVRVQYPGRAQRHNEEPCATIVALAEEIASHWQSLSGKPFAFYGHSFGALVAFELARHLRRRGIPGPEWLFVGCSRAPHLELPFDVIHTLPEDEFIQAIGSRYGEIPAEVIRDRELRDLFIKPLLADFTAYELYKAASEQPLSIPITAFAGSNDRAATPASMQEWFRHTEREFEVIVLPDGHFPSNSSQDALIGTIKARLLNIARPDHI